MSLNTNFKNFILKSVSKNSDSFDDRFCDDLCEDILQYLPLKDKLRRECVSKQFQRTVFQKQNEIVLGLNGGRRLPSHHEYYNPNLLRLKYPSVYAVLEEMDPQLEVLAFKSCFHKPIESLLKKCPNIQSIDLTRIETNNNEISKQIFQMITKYCNHLNEFNVLWFDLNEYKSQEFCRMFGSKLRNICGFCLKNICDLNIIKLFPNVQSFYLDTKLFQLDHIRQLNLNLLKQLTIYGREEKECVIREVLQKFPNIRHLSLCIKIFNEKSVFNVFKDSPLLQYLIELKIWIIGDRSAVFIINCLTQMAKKCPNLKRIEFKFSFEIILKNISDFEELMSSLKAFLHLKRLYICLKFMSGLEFDKIFSFKGFPQQLTHLSLGFNSEIKLNESHLKDLDINLPNLQYLKIKNMFDTTVEGVTQLSNILIRLTRLETIVLAFDPEVDFQPIREKIIEKCPKIRRIQI